MLTVGQVWGMFALAQAFAFCICCQAGINNGLSGFKVPLLLHGLCLISVVFLAVAWPHTSETHTPVACHDQGRACEPAVLAAGLDALKMTPLSLAHSRDNHGPVGCSGLIRIRRRGSDQSRQCFSTSLPSALCSTCIAHTAPQLEFEDPTVASHCKDCMAPPLAIGDILRFRPARTSVVGLKISINMDGLSNKPRKTVSISAFKRFAAGSANRNASSSGECSHPHSPMVGEISI